MNHFPFISQYMQLAKVRSRVYKWVEKAYAKRWEQYSDGMTCAPDLHIGRVFKLKHPIGVMHDYLYCHPKIMPRKGADQLLREGLHDFGYPVRAWIYYLAVRIFGRWFYGRQDKAGGVC